MQQQYSDVDPAHLLHHSLVQPQHPQPVSTMTANLISDYSNMNVGGGNCHVPLTSSPSHTLSIDTTYSTSAESGLEVDMEMCSSSSPQPISHVSATGKPPLTRRHTLTAMTGIPSAESMLRQIGGISIDSGHSMELPSESPSIESNLDHSDYNSPPESSNSYFSRQDNLCGANLPASQYGASNSTLDPYSHQRRHTRSPINFREGRRASDGLVCQDVIAFRQKLKDGMKAGGMLELRQEHNKLMESHSSDIDADANTPMEPPVKIPLGKRMSLPTNSIDLPPHRLLEIKKSIQLDQHLATSQDVHEISHPFWQMRPYEPVQTLPFNLQRQAHNRSMRGKSSYKQQSALHQQFQQMHIEHTSLVPNTITNLGRGVKHPPVARQPSYKLAQQQPVLPSVFNGGDTGLAGWDQTFLLHIANTCASSFTSANSVITNSVSHSVAISEDSTATFPLQNTLHPMSAAEPAHFPPQYTMDSEGNNMYYNN